METISIHVGLKDGGGKELPAQLLFSDGLAPEEVLVALRQAEGVAITLVVESAEQRGREQCAEPIPPPE